MSGFCHSLFLPHVSLSFAGVLLSCHQCNIILVKVVIRSNESFHGSRLDNDND